MIDQDTYDRCIRAGHTHEMATFFATRSAPIVEGQIGGDK